MEPKNLINRAVDVVQRQRTDILEKGRCQSRGDSMALFLTKSRVPTTSQEMKTDLVPVRSA